MKYKGQSSIEYLTTYSWMLVAVSVAAGTTFSAVDTTSCQRATYGFYSDSVDFEGYAINKNNTLIFSLQNEAYDDVEIKNISIELEDGQYRSRAASASIPSGEQATVGLPGYKLSNQCNTFDVTLEYEKGPLEDQTLSGQIKGPYETGSLPIPRPPTNVRVTI